jgi:hypothetical protein
MQSLNVLQPLLERSGFRVQGSRFRVQGSKPKTQTWNLELGTLKLPEAT